MIHITRKAFEGAYHLVRDLYGYISIGKCANEQVGYYRNLVAVPMLDRKISQSIQTLLDIIRQFSIYFQTLETLVIYLLVNVLMNRLVIIEI